MSHCCYCVVLVINVNNDDDDNKECLELTSRKNSRISVDAKYSGARLMRPYKEVRATVPSIIPSFIHPLLHKYTSGFNDKGPTDDLDGSEFTLLDRFKEFNVDL